MARKPTPTPENKVVPVAQDLVAQDVGAANQLAVLHDQQQATVRAVAAQMGYQLPADCTDPDLIQRDIAANMRRSVEACLQVGMGLRVLKEACAHGNYIARLDVLGIDRVVAWKFMQAASKFANVSSTKHLTAAIGSQAKLFEMIVLDEGQLEELELTGQTGELALDDVATMSLKDLRAAVREAKAEKEATDKLLADKNAKIDKLSRRIKKVTPDEVLQQLHSELAEHAATALGAVNGQMREAFSALAEHHANHGGDATQVMAGYVAQLQMTLIQLREDYMLPDLAGDGTPEWMTYTPPGATAPAAAPKGKH